MTRNINDQVYDVLDGLLLQCRNPRERHALHKAIAEYCTEEPRIEAILRRQYSELFMEDQPFLAVV